MADGQSFKYVIFHKPLKEHLHSLSDVCVQDRRPDIQCHNPRPNFIGQGIKIRPLSLPDRITYSTYIKCMHIVDCSSNNVPIVYNTAVYTALAIITCVCFFKTLENSEIVTYIKLWIANPHPDMNENCLHQTSFII